VNEPEKASTKTAKNGRAFQPRINTAEQGLKPAFLTRGFHPTGELAFPSISVSIRVHPESAKQAWWF
jgi:hypothetical protein